MKLIANIKGSVKNIISNKLRSILTMLGLIIGISSVIILVGISEGSNKRVNEKVKDLGTDLLSLNIYSKENSIKYEDLIEYANINNIKNIIPYKSIMKSVNINRENMQIANIVATNENYIDIQNLKIKSGRTLSIIDIENNNKVCILGNNIASSLFELNNPIGQCIKIDGYNFTIIGILEQQGEILGNNADNLVLIPITSAKYLGEDINIKDMYIQVENEEKIEETKNIITDYVRKTVQISTEEFSIASQDSMIEAMNDIDNTLSMLLIGVASISLLVGGIGVMNVMLVSVTERTKEIGIRKALGAKKIDILIQFLIESLVLCVLGGILGIILGIVIGLLTINLGFSFFISRSIIFIAFIVSTIIGLIFGIFPAYRASCLRPIDALRNE